MKTVIDAWGKYAVSLLQLILRDKLIAREDIFVRISQQTISEELVQFCDMAQIDYVISEYDSGLVERIQNFEPDIYLSLFSREKIPSAAFKTCRFTMNIHPSLLPKYRGCFSVPWVIINDEKKTGVTFHELSSKFDCGDIIYQKEIEIDKFETSYSLYAKIHSFIYLNFQDIFTQYVTGKLSPYKQDSSTDHYYRRELPFDGVFQKSWSIEEKERFDRAMYYPPFEIAKL